MSAPHNTGIRWASIWDSPLLASSEEEEEGGDGSRGLWRQRPPQSIRRLRVLQEDARAPEAEQARERHRPFSAVVGLEGLLLAWGPAPSCVAFTQRVGGADANRGAETESDR